MKENATNHSFLRMGSITLTVGYFQRVEKDINMDVVNERNMDSFVVKQAAGCTT